MEQAATPVGGAETSARPDASQAPSVHDRLKASLFGSPEPDKDRPPPKVEAEAPKVEPVKAEPEAPKEEPAEEPAAPNEQVEGDDAQQFSSMAELAEALGWDLTKVLDLETDTKIDGKAGKVRLRDLVKSYQLEGHLNQKLMTHAEEKKAFEAERQTHMQQQQQRMMQIDAAAQVAQRLLDGQFAGIDWPKLQLENPTEFNEKYVEYQQRQQALNHLADTIGKERQQGLAAQEAANKAYLQEQKQLLESKMPEWATVEHRQKALGEMAPLFEEAYGITRKELGDVVDHRQLLVARDAFRWQQLQKAKPAVLNKVRTAPKLLKPGTPQSRAAQENLQSNQDRARLRSTGKVAHAIPLLKRHLFQ